MGADLHNANRSYPEWQNLEVGDDIWMAPAGRYGESTKLEVAQLQPNRALVIGHPRRDSGEYVLVPTGDGNTRLIIRDRDDMGSKNVLSAIFTNAIYRPGHVIMERGQMLGIKALAEGALSERSLIERVSLVCVIAAALGLVAMLQGWPEDFESLSPSEAQGRGTWASILEKVDKGTTRLLRPLLDPFEHPPLHEQVVEDHVPRTRLVATSFPQEQAREP